MALFFLCVWGVAAVGLGALFALRPAAVADRYIREMGRTALSRRLQQRLAPRWAVLIWYRVGGIVFMALGILLPVLGFTGVIPT